MNANARISWKDTLNFAPTCPISKGQSPPVRPLGPTFPTPPIATDLASLIAAVNALRAVLMQFTGQWTVNNLFEAPEPNTKIEGNTYYSQYPEWEQYAIQWSQGFVYHKDSNGTDTTQRAYVNRINQVNYKNRSQEDPDFIWAYYKALDG